jgi:hypothetical protein
VPRGTVTIGTVIPPTLFEARKPSPMIDAIRMSALDAIEGSPFMVNLIESKRVYLFQGSHHLGTTWLYNGIHNGYELWHDKSIVINWEAWCSGIIYPLGYKHDLSSDLTTFMTMESRIHDQVVTAFVWI